MIVVLLEVKLFQKVVFKSYMQSLLEKDIEKLSFRELLKHLFGQRTIVWDECLFTWIGKSCIKDVRLVKMDREGIFVNVVELISNICTYWCVA